MKVLLVLALATCSSCLPLGRDEHLTQLAKEIWPNCGPPAYCANPAPITAGRCIGLPGYIGTTCWVPFPWSEWDFTAKLVLTYEFSKLSYTLRGRSAADGSWEWYGPLLWLDAALHLPPSEFHSWYRVAFPGDDSANK